MTKGDQQPRGRRARGESTPPRARPLQLTCPVCDSGFTTQVFAATGCAGQDTDFRPRFPEGDPLPHLVHVCPECGYGAMRDGFDEVEPVVREWVLAQGLGAQTPCGGAERWLRAAACRSVALAHTPDELGQLYARAAWCARAQGERELERRCQRDAVLAFERALAEGYVGEDDQQMILYLVGELYRRLGLFPLARVMLERAGQVAGVGKYGDALSRLVERQLRAAEERCSDNMQI